MAAKIKNDDGNCEKLADEVIDSWDMQCLLEYAQSSLVASYRDDDEKFQTDWKTMEMKEVENAN